MLLYNNTYQYSIPLTNTSASRETLVQGSRASVKQNQIMKFIKENKCARIGLNQSGKHN